MAMENSNPLVSVVIPVYNMEQYLAETLDSVLASDYSPFEVVAIDDGSKDNSMKILQEYARKDSRVRVLSQPNSGVCVARNNAISNAKGEFILPIDSDDKIKEYFISDAVKAITSDKDVKVVRPLAEYFGDKEGVWKLQDFSLGLLARKNMIPISCLFYRKDWERVGGYEVNIQAREDWAFWIAVLKDGGKVVTLNRTELYYRIRSGSKRQSDRKLKHHIIDVLNSRHPEFFERELGGPLRYNRSWSRVINKVYRLFHPRKVYINSEYQAMRDYVAVMPQMFANNNGTIIYDGRNQLRQFTIDGKEIVVKSFKKPNFINRIVYGLFRSSKAQRSYEYAELLQSYGIGTPQPVGYCTVRNGLLFTNSYYASLRSECKYSFIDLMDVEFPHREPVLRAIGQLAAKMHSNGMIHRDFSRGNILFNVTENDDVTLEIIDLNRIRFHKIGKEEGCKNFERLPIDADAMRIMTAAYAEVLGCDPDECYSIVSNSVREEIEKRAKKNEGK